MKKDSLISMKSKKITNKDVVDIVHAVRASEHKGKWTKEEQKGLLIKKLRSFWEKLRNLQIKHSEEIGKLEREMNQEVKIKIPLEFFYVDGQLAGIGAREYAARKDFPLIHSRQLDREED